MRPSEGLGNERRTVEGRQQCWHAATSPLLALTRTALFLSEGKDNTIIPLVRKQI